MPPRLDPEVQEPPPEPEPLPELPPEMQAFTVAFSAAMRPILDEQRAASERAVKAQADAAHLT